MSLQRKSTGELLMKANNALMDDCCCAPSCSSAVNGPWTIQGYVDGMFDTSCTILPAPCGGGDRVWDGVFHQRNSDPCRYTAQFPQPPVIEDLCYIGLMLESGNTNILFFGGVWRLKVTLQNTTLWTGTKATGSTPEGIYTQTLGCSDGPALGPATLTVS